jgi:hypothetical protein
MDCGYPHDLAPSLQLRSATTLPGYRQFAPRLSRRVGSAGATVLA